MSMIEKAANYLPSFSHGEIRIEEKVSIDFSLNTDVPYFTKK